MSVKADGAPEAGAGAGQRRTSQRHWNGMWPGKRRGTITKLAEGTLKTLTQALEWGEGASARPSRASSEKQITGESRRRWCWD